MKMRGINMTNPVAQNQARFVHSNFVKAVILHIVLRALSTKMINTRHARVPFALIVSN